MEGDTKNNAEPVVASDEMKMPEEQFGTTAVAAEEGDKTAQLGAILGVLIVILVLILGGLYLWGSTLQNTAPAPAQPAVERPTAEENNEPESTNAEAEVETMGALSTSNEIEAIEADLESTDLDNLDAELDAIDAELDNALNSI